MFEFPDTQSALLVQIKSPDNHDAWEQFVTLYRPVIFRTARRRGLQEADAQDLTQRVLASIAQSIHRWKKTEPTVRFRHWLRRVAKNAIINALTRQPMDRATGSLSGQHRLLELPDSKTQAESKREIALAYHRELFQLAATLVKNDVTPETWRAFELSVVQEQPVEQVANELEKSVGAVYAARGRVLRRLQETVQRLENN